MTRADNPTVEGTKINKNSLLKDATAALFGLGTDAVPDDVLALIKSVIDGNYAELSAAIAAAPKLIAGSYTGTNVYGIDNPSHLTFSTPPKLLIISTTETTSYGVSVAIFANPQTSYLHTLALNGDASGTTTGQVMYYKASGNTIYWYNTRGVGTQNNRAQKYYYVAFCT